MMPRTEVSLRPASNDVKRKNLSLYEKGCVILYKESRWAWRKAFDSNTRVGSISGIRSCPALEQVQTSKAR